VHQDAEAEAEFRKLAGQSWGRTAAPLIGLSRLGVTRAMRGEATESVASYQRFLSDGSKADADLPVMAQAKCELQREEAVARQPAGSGGVVNFAIFVHGS
jgi:hypothetical protein